jgi:formate hydrogenlyase subunit 3/multisubunit Na+/H+ antiporter MnhD subunit
MVTPIYIIAILLGSAFFLGFFGKKSKSIYAIISTIALGLTAFISIDWLIGLWNGNYTESFIYTAGLKPPFSINLFIGMQEAIVISIINVVGILSAIYLGKEIKEQGKKAFIPLLLIFMGLNVIVMTRDLFNLFVFLEISSISLAGLIILSRATHSFAAAFKYMMATAIIAAFLLLGIIFLYYFTGTLNIDDPQITAVTGIKGYTVAAFLLIVALILEIKPFPANGWALDVYQVAPAGVSSIISAAYLTASLFVLHKMAPIVGTPFLQIITVIGLISFLASNLLGIRQKNANRLLGYSSIGQAGLVMAVIGLQEYLGDKYLFIAFSILITHVIAKAGLFWISGIIRKEKTKDWSILKNNKILLIAFGVFAIALTGFPPFPSFFGKWELVMQLSNNGKFLWVGIILLASFFEIVYLFRWLGEILKSEKTEEILSFNIKTFLAPVLAVVLLFVGSYFISQMHEYGKLIQYLPLAVALAFFFIDFLPVYIKNTLAIAAVGGYLYYIYPDLASFNLVFALIFLVGGILTLIAGYAYKGKRSGFFPMALMMFAGLIGLIEAKTTLDFFYAWEIMTIGSYFLILRGKNAKKHAYSYLLFSVGGAYAILAAFGLAAIGQQTIDLSILSTTLYFTPIIFLLLAIGFMTKTASLGLHIWLPGAHAEAETDVSPMVSAILLKAGLFGLIMMMLLMGDQLIWGISISYLLGWIGVFSAIIGNLMAAFQEDAKKLLAYSSIGVMGYALFGLALMSHLGWLAATATAVTHFMFKALLFLAIGGVVWRVKTKNMYQMGGLIKKMPFSFISVLIGIIVLAGVPPLTGFAGKWIFFNAIVEKEWYLQGALIAFAGIIAFLYCFRLIHTIFLGQLKDEHRQIKEAPIWILIPQFAILAVIMIFSALPNSLLQPIGEFLKPIFPEGALIWDGQNAYSSLGYWNGKLIMYVVVGIFAAVFFWLIFWNRKVKKVKQFNIVYAAERPERPETTHYAYNFFAHYRKAVGILAEPKITAFWNGIAEATNAIAEKIRKIFNGDGQTYVLHIIVFVLFVYLLSFGGF